MIGGPGEAAKDAWMDRVYHPFRERVRRDLFLSLAVHCYQNQPLPGYYLEFGCHGARTMRLAWDAFGTLFDWTFVGFDSFAGLPEMDEADRLAIWGPGARHTTEDEFVGLVTAHGLPRPRLLTVKGFYEESLDAACQARLLPTPAAVVYVDCDLYASTVPVLEFVRPFLQHGTVIVFDDWFCFHGDPQRGERRAFAEFQARHPGLRFEEYVRTGEAQAFIHLAPHPP